MADPDNPPSSGPDNSGQEQKCRNCGAVKKPNVKWPAPKYCSGKCMKLDGLTPVATAEPARTAPPVKNAATLKDYQDSPGRYRRRHDPEKLNWGDPLTREQLKQAGLRANREPIPGDWDYKAVPEETEPPRKEEENA